MTFPKKSSIYLATSIISEAASSFSFQESIHTLCVVCLSSRVLVFYYSFSKLSTRQWLKTVQIYHLTVLQLRSVKQCFSLHQVKIKVQQGSIPSSGSREGPGSLLIQIVGRILSFVVVTLKSLFFLQAVTLGLLPASRGHTHFQSSSLHLQSQEQPIKPLSNFESLLPLLSHLWDLGRNNCPILGYQITYDNNPTSSSLILITSANFHYSCRKRYLNVLGSRAWTSLGRSMNLPPTYLTSISTHVLTEFMNYHIVAHGKYLRTKNTTSMAMQTCQWH